MKKLVATKINSLARGYSQRASSSCAAVKRAGISRLPDHEAQIVKPLVARGIEPVITLGWSHLTTLAAEDPERHLIKEFSEEIKLFTSKFQLQEEAPHKAACRY